MNNKVKELTDKEIKEEAEKRNISLPRRINIIINPDDFLYCDKCGAPVDKEGKYKHD